jgi:hypothetical protein
MNKKLLFISLVLLLGLALVTACSGFIPDTGVVNPAITQQPGSGSSNSDAQQAMQTQIAQLSTQVAQISRTPEVTQNPVITATPLPPTVTAEPTQVPPTATPTATAVPPTPTATPLPCNLAQFVGDVTYPDGTLVSSGNGFTKTWRLRNAGSCTWTSDYDLVFYDGDQMNARSVIPFNGNVHPGEEVDLSVNLIAPVNAGSYRGYWMLRDASGALFGLGRQDNAFYVDIQVPSPEDVNPLDFAAGYCLAEWSSGAGRLPCQGDRSDTRGYVRRIDKPILESGYQDDEPVLLTQPQMVNDGIIRGKYPAIRVEDGYTFQAVIGCANKATACDVNFQLDYQIGTGSIHTLATWHEIYDEQFNLVTVDLSSLAGKDVKFILTVLSNGSSKQDQAQWLAPHISQGDLTPHPRPKPQ